ncbi:MAG: xylose isomerase [Defluviitaleaceae bacterium]|nr:xylose isomerase [Defluviitaleaceae bacterium]
MSYFPDVAKIKYEGKGSKNPFAFKHYNPEEIVLGKTMEDHMRFAVAYWHTFASDGAKGQDPFGMKTMTRPWESTDPLEEARQKAYANFEFLEKLGVPFFAFHDLDVAPEGTSLEEYHANLDEITDIFKAEMERTGIKLLWNTSNAFSHPRFVNGAATSPNAETYAHAAAQVKKGLDIAKKLGAENYVFWGGREGYEYLQITDYKLEQDNQAKFYWMAVNYAKEIGYTGQFLIEPKPKEPTKHQYDFDSATTIAFLKSYGLDEHFKLNLEANHATLAMHTFDHEIRVAAAAGLLGSIDANQGDLLLGWDTDEFPTDLAASTLAVYEIVKAGGLGSGGVNFDSKVRRSSTDLNDLFLAHIAGMDTWARALKTTERLINDKFFDNIVTERYDTFYNTEVGKSVLDGTATLASLSEYAIAKKDEQIKVISDRLEYVKAQLNEYIF